MEARAFRTGDLRRNCHAAPRRRRQFLQSPVRVFPESRQTQAEST